ncbi:MAG: acyl carrier protein [Phycisphaerae bacterium]|nr:acyl carrier protein [Phycisphaerae bacterium]
MPDNSQVRQIISDVLGVPAASLTAASSPETIESWDSVQHLSLVMALESSLGVQFAPEDIEKMRSVGAVEAMVAAKRR